MPPSRLVSLAFVLAVSSLPARAVDYVREVKPILVAHCYACHGALQQKAGLRLDSVALVRYPTRECEPVVAHPIVTMYVLSCPERQP